MSERDIYVSREVAEGAASQRTEADVRAIRARRAALAQALRDEGQSEDTVARLATDDMAERLIQHERRVVDMIFDAAFGGRGLG